MTVLNGLLSAADWILQTSLKSSVLIGLILMVQWILRNKLSGGWRYALWLLLIVRMVIPYGLESRLSIFNMSPLKEEVVVTPTGVEPTQLQSTPSADYTTPASSTVTLPSVENHQSRPSLSPEHILTLIWLLGVCVMFISTFIGNVRLWRQLKKCNVVTDKKMLNQFNRCKKEMHISQHVELIQLAHIRVPALYGLLKPRILLPDNVAASFKMNDFKNIFYHELAHLKRRDVLVAWITTILQICHWFNPIIWFAFFRIRMDRELACDEMTLTHIGSGGSREYGRTLLALLNHVSSEYRIPITVGILETRSNLRNRMKRIAQFNRSTLFWVFAAVVIIVGLGCLSLTEARKRKPYASEIIISIGADDTVRMNDKIVTGDSLSIYLNKYRFDENSLVTLAPEMNITMGQFFCVSNQMNLINFNGIRHVNAISGESVTTQHKRYMPVLESSINIETLKKDELNSYVKHDHDTITAIIVDPRTEKSYFFHEGLAAVLLDDKWGFINRTGKFLIEPIYDEVMFFTDGLAPVKIEDKWGYINRNGNTIIDLQYDRALPFRDGLAEVKLNGKYGFINKAGKIQIEPIYDSVSSFSEGLAKFRINGKCGFIDKRGNVVIEPIFEDSRPFSMGHAAMKLDSKWGFIDKTGVNTLDYQFDDVGFFYEDLTWFRIKDRYGYIDQKGNVIIQPKYQDAEEFMEGLAAVKMNNGKYGYIDATGRIIIQPQFDFVSDFNRGIAIVTIFEDPEKQIPAHGYTIDQAGNILERHDPKNKRNQQ